jgi:uncharacterized protein YbjT (DUF2867 family)
MKFRVPEVQGSLAFRDEISTLGSAQTIDDDRPFSSAGTMESRKESSMKIVVVGGNGLIGGKLVARLRLLGHEVLAASPRSGVNAVTGDGLAEALAGAGVVVDVMNSPSFEDSEVLKFFESTSRNLAAAEAKAGVRHHVALSVVGTDRLQDSGYFRGKLAQEKLIESSGIPFTLVRATQFFEFLRAIGDLNTVRDASGGGGEIRLPSTLMQPMSAEDVAMALVHNTLAEPVGGIVEIAGPEVFGMDEAIRKVLIASGDQRRVITDSSATYYGMLMGERSLTPGSGAHITPTRLDEWLKLNQ